jgi:hypothetical protein
MSDDFRAAAREKISRLLDKWKSIEGSIKIAEQISSEAQIPAINELRYASRQLFNAVMLIDKIELTGDDRQKIDQHITVAGQYLLNAEHDIADAVVTFFHSVVADVEVRYGRNIITTHFPRFPLFRDHIKQCERLIAETRGNYELRSDNYRQIRENHIPHLVDMHEALIESQVSAEEERQRAARELVIAKGKVRLYGFGMLALAIIAILEPPILWWMPPDKLCKWYGEKPILRPICK